MVTSNASYTVADALRAVFPVGTRLWTRKDEIPVEVLGPGGPWHGLPALQCLILGRTENIPVHHLQNSETPAELLVGSHI